MAFNTTSQFVSFYPTKRGIIAKMLEGCKFNKQSTWLDIGAGKGAFADYIQAKTRQYHHKHRDYSRGKADVDVIEVHKDLQHILRGKEHTLIHDDFLTFETRKPYTYLVGNFPFHIGAECLEHALELLEQNGGELRCLVNAETLKNPHTAQRQRVVTKLAQLDAHVEYWEGEFTTAPRETDVSVAFVKVVVERQERPSIILASLKTAEERRVNDPQYTQLMSGDFITSIVALFQTECNLGVRLIEEWHALKPYLKDRLKSVGEGEYDYSKPLIKLEINGEDYFKTIEDEVNCYLRGVRRKYWEALLRDKRFTAEYTSNIINELEKRLKELESCDFSAFNILRLQQELQEKVLQGIEAAILELFDKFSGKYAYHEDVQNGNVWYWNGWKSNKAWKVSDKIILRNHSLQKEWNGKKKLSYGTGQNLSDMVKVFNYLARLECKISNIPQLTGNVVNCAEHYQDFTLDLNWFTLTYYLKGTVHVKFTDKDMLDKFNLYAARKRNWLPPRYGKATYEEMTPEEQAVVDEFQGREAYAKVMANPSFWLVDDSTMLLNCGERLALAE